MVAAARILPALLMLVAVLGCAPSRPNPTPEATTASQPAQPKRITVGVQTDFNAVVTRMVRSGAGTRPGMTEIEQLLNAGLTQLDHTNAIAPQLAEAVPS